MLKTAFRAIAATCDKVEIFPVSLDFNYGGTELSLYNYHGPCGDLTYPNACVVSNGLITYLTEQKAIQELRFEIAVAELVKGYGVIKLTDQGSISAA